MLKPVNPVEFSPEARPELIVVVDTEEEFDWSKLPDPSNSSVSAIDQIGRVQDIFDEYGIVPCYVIDYPIASHTDGIENLKPILDQGRCEVGSHLHPWVNPPYDEAMSWPNTYPGNLPPELEFSKLEILTDTIEKNFAQRPTIYKAGRYGVGENTTEILRRLGYRIDLSICSAFDYRADGGPDFTSFGAKPYWFGSGREMLEIPLSGAFVGMAGAMASHVYNLSGYFDILKARGILSRLGIVDRLMLSPEGYQFSEHKKLTDFLIRKGVRTFTWNFHSPTVVPGMTMYTQSEREVGSFLDSFRRFFDYFFGDLNGISTTPTKIRRKLESIQ